MSVDELVLEIKQRIKGCREILSYYEEQYRTEPDDSFYKKSFKRYINMYQGQLAAYRCMLVFISMGGDDNGDK